MVLMQANPLQGPLEGLVSEKSRLFWALKWQRAKRVPVRPFSTPLPMAQVLMDLPPPTSLSPIAIEKQVHW